ncbi:hypothetical protein [Synechococcus sp. A15-24]|nr:hypothetical protein [Synechococcus sp. A15-24]QNJ28146.1 hypothetical protein SynA1524_00436 [Synechococcus sp. A15-24]
MNDAFLRKLPEKGGMPHEIVCIFHLGSFDSSSTCALYQRQASLPVNAEV